MIDVTWLMGPVFIWTTIEPCVAIVCAYLPHLAPFSRQVHESVLLVSARAGSPTLRRQVGRGRVGVSIGDSGGVWRIMRLG